MIKKVLIYLSFIIVLTLFSAFIYTLVLYKTENEKFYNLITLLLGAVFFFLIGISTRFFNNKHFILYSLLIFLILSLIIFIIKTLALNSTPEIISYKHLINLFSTICGSLLFKKRKI